MLQLVSTKYSCVKAVRYGRESVRSAATRQSPELNRKQRTAVRRVHSLPYRNNESGAVRQIKVSSFR